MATEFIVRDFQPRAPIIHSVNGDNDNPEIKENWDTQFGDRENQVVFIGKGHNKDDIIVELEKCLDERAYA